MPETFSIENDLRAIAAVNQCDVKAALAGNVSMMVSQWTDDFVLLPPAGPVLRRRDSIAEAFRGVENPGIVGYVLDIQEVKVFGDHAFQWGTHRYDVRPHAESEIIRTSGKIMRILQRQRDGSWKILRGIPPLIHRQYKSGPFERVQG
jgi:uncharacterized protein (TIGR02246 family)